ncbi:MAG TPA: hypothetical protein VF060_14845, partial [Trebonia sp.]
LMLGTPQPGVFLKWIMALATLAAVVYPFSTGAPLDQKIATAAVCLVLGVAIASLLAAVAVRAVRRVETRNHLRGGYGQGNRGYDDRPGPRGYDGRGYGDREYGRPDYDRGPQGYDRPGYERGGYESPTRQYPPRDRWS